MDDQDQPERSFGEKVKQHLKDHKKEYLIGAGCLVVGAGITWLIVRGRHAGIPRVPDGSDAITVRPLSFLSKQNVVTVIERDGRGHPGYLIRCLTTGEVFSSQKEAARQLGLYPSVVSGHLNGKIPDAGGYLFERIAA